VYVRPIIVICFVPLYRPSCPGTRARVSVCARVRVRVCHICTKTYCP